jgi:hypothetical protein
MTGIVLQTIHRVLLGVRVALPTADDAAGSPNRGGAAPSLRAPGHGARCRG